MVLISSVFVGAVFVVLGCLVWVGVIIWQALRSVEIGDQLLLPFTADEYTSWDDAVTRVARERSSDE